MVHRHIAELQSIRGLAALVVLVSHCLLVFSDAFLPLSSLVGRWAVVTFFVLSGYVLGQSLAKERVTVETLRRYYLKRVFRIYPAAFFACAATFLFLYLVDFEIPGSSAWFLRFYKDEDFTTLNVLASFVGFSGFLVPPMWSILVEVIGSILLPALVVARIAKRSVAIWLVGALFLLSYAIGPLPHPFFTYLGSFALGAFIPLFAADFSRIFSGRWFFVWAIVGAAMVISAGVRLLSPDRLDDTIVTVFDSVGSCLLIGSVLARPSANAFLRLKPIVWLGDISYSVYLLHFAVMLLVAIVVSSFGLSPVNETAILTVLTAALTLGAASLTYRFIELPGIAFGKSVIEGTSRPALERPATLG